ncbi:FAD:protein FMN transferase [Streptosporangium soli]|nr:FAD:protein FMN transferase [Streptosporangium sp. KLBMP 9127]
MAFPGTARVQQVMGVPVDVHVRTALPARELAPLLDDAFSWLGWVERTFGPGGADGSLSRLARGEITAAECAPEVSEVLDRHAGLSLSAHLTGEPDLSGYVMGWAVERLSRALSTAGAVDHRVSAGGNVRVRGSASPGERWRIGVRDPRSGLVFKVLFAHDLAVATTGELGSVTVAGPDLGVAAAHASAIHAMTPAVARRFAARLGGAGPYDVLIVDRERRAVSTPGLAAHASVTSTRLAG